MPEIAKMLTEDYRDLLEKCVHCGLCLEACPTYAVFGTEMDAPRGRITLMRAAVEGKISEDEFLNTFAEHITLCLECRACESACPSGVQYGKLIEGARIALEELRSPGPGERFVSWLGMHQLMPHIGQMKLMARAMWLYEAIGLQWVVRTLNILPQPLKAMEGILPDIASQWPDYSTPAPAMGTKRGTVAFFYGCIQEAFLSAINAATVRVLQRNGYEVHFPQTQTCCGAAQWHTGAEPLARELAKQNIDSFEPYDIVVNNAGGCGLTLKEYPDLLHDDPEYKDKAIAFAEKVQDFSEFVHANLHVKPEGELRITATYSDSCHLRHGQGVIDQPRELLEMIPGLTLLELAHPDWCCGSAGIYNIVQAETANAVLDRKMEDVAATGAEVLVTSNTGCHMQLVSGVRKWNLNMKVLHIAEMLDLSYQADDRRLRAEVRHPKPLIKNKQAPEHWLAWADKRRKHKVSGGPLDSLKLLLQPGQVIDNPVELLTYHVDGGLDKGVPVGVVFPYTSEDVQLIQRWAKEHDVPTVARGAGTGLAGNAVALRGALILGFSNMKALVDFDVAGRSAVVEPGMVNLRLDEIARGEGLYFPPDPASGRAATVGGNIGANAGGPHCFKYGVTSNYVTGMDVVMENGDLVRMGGRAADYPEYDLTGLMTGAEGTLGIMTRAYVRMLANPPAVKTLLAAFDSVAQAGEAVSAVIAAGLVPATMEMMGHRIMGLVEEYNHPGLPTHAGAALIIDMDGYPDSVQPQLDEVQQILHANGAIELRVAKTEAERAKIWYARKSAAGAMARLAIDHYTVDGSVPRSELANTLREVIKISEEEELETLFLLHAGDGNLHPMVLVYDPEDEEFLKKLHKGGRRMAELFVAKGGTITGEHGVGIEKREFMALMYTEEELNVMRGVKKLFDPRSLLNPDKVFPLDTQSQVRPLVDSTSRPVGDAVTGGTLTPATLEEAVDMVRAQQAAGIAFNVRGSGTKSALLPQAPVTLSTAGLSGIRTYAKDDLYVKAGAGTTIAELKAVLEPDGMTVPLGSPWANATLGGIVSANFNAPLRGRYGAIRDLVQAMTVVMPDGKVLQLGRPVMKNVAGYDLGKLFIGAYGTLGLITDLTFKLVPTPRARQTVAVAVPDSATGLKWGRVLAAHSVIASSVLLTHGVDIPGVAGDVLVYTAEGLAEDVAAEMLQVNAILTGNGATPVLLASTNSASTSSAGASSSSAGASSSSAGTSSGLASGTALWQAWMAQPVTEGVLLRVGVANSDLRKLDFEKAGFDKLSQHFGKLSEQRFDKLGEQDRELSEQDRGLSVQDRGLSLSKPPRDESKPSYIIDVMNGLAYIRGAVNVAALRREAAALEGYAVLLAGDADAGVWGFQPGALRYMQALKALWDEKDVFGPGTFVV